MSMGMSGGMSLSGSMPAYSASSVQHCISIMSVLLSSLSYQSHTEHQCELQSD